MRRSKQRALFCLLTVVLLFENQMQLWVPKRCRCKACRAAKKEREVVWYTTTKPGDQQSSRRRVSEKNTLTSIWSFIAPRSDR